jgi:hypothetical protein
MAKAAGEEAIEIGAHGIGIGADRIEDDEITQSYCIGQQEPLRRA